MNHGRKGIAYDWQSLYAPVDSAALDAELALLVDQLTVPDRRRG